MFVTIYHAGNVLNTLMHCIRVWAQGSPSLTRLHRLPHNRQGSDRTPNIHIRLMCFSCELTHHKCQCSIPELRLAPGSRPGTPQQPRQQAGPRGSSGLQGGCPVLSRDGPTSSPGRSGCGCHGCGAGCCQCAPALSTHPQDWRQIYDTPA